MAEDPQGPSAQTSPEESAVTCVGFGNSNRFYELCESFKEFAIHKELGLVAFLSESKFYTVDWLKSEKWFKNAKPNISKKTFYDTVIPELILKNAAESLSDPRVALMLSSRSMFSPMTDSTLMNGCQCPLCMSIFLNQKSFDSHVNSKGSKCKAAKGRWDTCKQYQPAWINGVKQNIKISDHRVVSTVETPRTSLDQFLNERRDAITLAKRQ